MVFLHQLQSRCEMQRQRVTLSHAVHAAYIIVQLVQSDHLHQRERPEQVHYGSQSQDQDFLHSGTSEHLQQEQL